MTKKRNRRPNREVPSQDVIDSNIRQGLSINADANNYLTWIGDLCTPFLGRKVLEIGAGQGEFTELFSKQGEVIATELSSHSLEDLHYRFDANPRVLVRTFDIFSSTETFEVDSIALINVLEHIEHDVNALTQLRRHLNREGHLILYVPAFWLLYSRFDNSIGHYRRYSKRELNQVVGDAGFEVVQSRYVNSIGAIGWFVICRLMGRPASEGTSVGVMNRVIIPLVRRFENRFRPPFGISIFCVARPQSSGDEGVLKI